MSCPRRSCTCGGPQRESYLSFPPSSRTSLLLCRDRPLAPIQTQRNATQPKQRDATRPNHHPFWSQPSPTQPVLSQSEARKARAATEGASNLVSVPRVPAGWSLPGDPRSSSRTGPAPDARPHPVSTLAAHLPWLPTQSGRTNDLCLRDSPGLLPRQSLPACLSACLPFCLFACLPDFLPARTQTRSTIHTRPNKAHLLILVLSCPALPCLDPASHFCTLHAAPRRATCPAYLSRAPRYTQSHSPTVHGQPPRGRPCPAHTPCPH